MRDVLKGKYHIISKKTLDAQFIFPMETIPEDFQGAFVRGFIDGDGYMGNNRCENNFSISIVGTSLSFVTQIGDLVSKNTGMSYSIHTTHGKTCNYYALRWSCDHKDKLLKITKLKNYLYTNATLYLSRKKKEIDRYIEYRAN